MRRLCAALLTIAVMAQPLVSFGQKEGEEKAVPVIPSAIYHFAERGGDLIHDSSGNEPPLDLLIHQPHMVLWKHEALSITGAPVISSKSLPTRLIDSIRESGELSLELWIRPADIRQKGPARIVTISADSTHRNITIGQDGDRLDVRCRTGKTDENGIPSTASDSGSLTPAMTHVVYTRDQTGAGTIYLNGVQRGRRIIQGELENWSSDFPLVLSNERGGDRSWHGEYHYLAIYNESMHPEHVKDSFEAGPPLSINYTDRLPSAVSRAVDFDRDVFPILRTKCLTCHSGDRVEGGINLGSRLSLLEGGKSGRMVQIGNSGSSRLIHVTSGLDELIKMPPEGDRLSAEEIGILRSWIDRGLSWPITSEVAHRRTLDVATHWAYQPLAEIEPPDPNPDEPSNPIDRFIVARQKERGLIAAGRTDDRRLTRRMFFDVVGLPPLPGDVNQFCVSAAEDRDAAVASMADKLLESHHYGERWGRHWLDVARYADSDGPEADRDRPNAWRYRDFVIRSLNEDRSFDEFIRWQIAGDELEPDNLNALAATGFLTAGPNTVLDTTFLEEERLRNRYNELDDILSTVGSAVLGLSIGCARCHDHKYDAISSREYYRMLSVFHSGDRKIVEIPGRTESDTKTLVLAFQDFSATPHPSWLFERGDFRDRAQEVDLGFLSILSRGKRAEKYYQRALESRTHSSSTGNRAALADWLTDVEYGAGAIVARVIVNRVWHYHFGAGMVRSVSDFGVRGETPSHPELLEWLAHDFVEHGWRLKRLHKMILTSLTYRQSDSSMQSNHELDPENRYLWRMRPRRLEPEILRDAMLVVSKRLERTPYGEAFKAPISDEAMVARNLKSTYPKDIADGPENHRRSVYMFHKRVIPYPLFQAFDKPDSLQSCGIRLRTTVAPQALALLNDSFVRLRSEDFADRLIRACGDNTKDSIALAFAVALSRAVSPSEMQVAVDFINRQEDSRVQSGDENGMRAALTDFCQAIMGLNEFLYVD